MAWFRRKPDERAAPQSSSEMMQFFAPYMMPAASGEIVTVDSALGVPAVMAAVEVISSSVAGLPLRVFTKSADGRKPTNPNLQAVLNDVANDADLLSAYDWMKWWVEQALTGGRGVTWLERGPTGRVLNLWPLDPDKLTIRKVNGRKEYAYKDGIRTHLYSASEVLDLPFMVKANGFDARSPIFTNRDVIGLAQAVTKYGSTYFANGGVPPFAVTGGFQSGASMQRAADDMAQAVKNAAKEKRQALVLPSGLDIKQIGSDAEKSQMTETQRFIIEQIARIYSLPPILLQDLTHGTFSNTEQQDLHFVKHTIMRWVGQIEGELNLKLFGRKARTTYVEFNLDGLLRGDFMTRMQGYAQAIQNGVLMPNEARELENRGWADGGDKLLVQGAMIPLESAGQQITAADPIKGDDNAA